MTNTVTTGTYPRPTAGDAVVAVIASESASDGDLAAELVAAMKGWEELTLRLDSYTRDHRIVHTADEWIAIYRDVVTEPRCLGCSEY